MKENFTNGELGIMLENLCDKVDEGFSGVHKRQDTTNGNVIKNTEFRLNTTATLKTLKYLVAIFGIGTIFNVVSNWTSFFN